MNIGFIDGHRTSSRLQLIKVNNLLQYLSEIVIKCESVSIVNLFNCSIKESEIKSLLNQLKGGINPDDMMILSIYYIERIIKKKILINSSNKFDVLWIICLLSCKYMLDPDNEYELEHLVNLGGYTIEDYTQFEILLLKNLDWKLEISDKDYERLKEVSKKNI